MKECQVSIIKKKKKIVENFKFIKTEKKNPIMLLSKKYVLSGYWIKKIYWYY
jgi:hypothetical protein